MTVANRTTASNRCRPVLFYGSANGLGRVADRWHACLILFGDNFSDDLDLQVACGIRGQSFSDRHPIAGCPHRIE